MTNDKNTSDDIGHAGLYQALTEAQMHMVMAEKKSVNPMYKSKYADLTSVIYACVPALNANGIAVIQAPYQTDDGHHYVRTQFVFSRTGETVECSVPLIFSKNDMQGYGSAVTYARRYGLMCLAAIGSEDDDGMAATQSHRNATLPVDINPAAVCAQIRNADNINDLLEMWWRLPASARQLQSVIDAKNAKKHSLTHSETE